MLFAGGLHDAQMVRMQMGAGRQGKTRLLALVLRRIG